MDQKLMLTGQSTEWGPAMVAPDAVTMCRQLVLTNKEVDAQVVWRVLTV
jgi:hypothetical protein